MLLLLGMQLLLAILLLNDGQSLLLQGHERVTAHGQDPITGGKPAIMRPRIGSLHKINQVHPNQMGGNILDS